MSAWVSALACVLAMIPADLSLRAWGSPRNVLWPIDATQRYLAVALIAGLAGAFAALARIPRWAGMLALAVGGGVVAWGLLSAVAPEYMPRALLAGLVGGAAAHMTIACPLLARVSHRCARATTPVCIACMMLGAGPVLYLAGYAQGAQLTGSLAAMAGALAIGSALFRGQPLGIGACAVLVGVLDAILLVAFGFRDRPATPALVALAIAPCAPGVALLPAVENAGKGRGVIASIGATVAAVLVAAGLAWMHHARTLGPGY